MTTEVSIEWAQGRTVPVSVYSGGRSPAVLLAQGAGAGREHPGMVVLRNGIHAGGFPLISFDYPYMAEARRRPDRQETLLAAHRAVADWTRENVSSGVVLAGRSMGGRIGTHLAAEGEAAVGLILYAYPLHPIGKPDRLRKDHLPAIRQPMQFFIGTRDAMAKPELVAEWIEPLTETTVTWVEDGDHSFRVRKASGRSQDEVFEAIIAQSVSFLEGL